MLIEVLDESYFKKLNSEWVEIAVKNNTSLIHVFSIQIFKYRTISFSATSYYLTNGIFVERTKQEVVLYERSYYSRARTIREIVCTYNNSSSVGTLEISVECWIQSVEIEGSGPSPSFSCKTSGRNWGSLTIGSSGSVHGIKTSSVSTTPISAQLDKKIMILYKTRLKVNSVLDHEPIQFLIFSIQFNYSQYYQTLSTINSCDNLCEIPKCFY